MAWRHLLCRTLKVYSTRRATFPEHFVVNVGGRSTKHYDEAWPIAEVVAKAIADANRTPSRSVTFLGKNGGLTGCMEAFGNAYKAHGVTWYPVLTSELAIPAYSPPIALTNPRRLPFKTNNTERLDEIIKSHSNRLLLVTAGGTGTLEEISAALCENEFRIKWSKEAKAKPFPIFVVGDVAVSQWRPILSQVFTQLTDTHPGVEELIKFISTEYVKKPYFTDEINKVLLGR